ncbi:hypothetical protein ACQEVF_16530 [Nonomuraea polychroma]|uniref:hypothetical protein n=1 Tax=Nonomuraea polychroma TaxID=46176 RepID=UPI003D8A3BBE
MTHQWRLWIEVRQLTHDLVADVRRVVHDLRPATLDELGLAGALEDLALDLEAAARCRWTSPNRCQSCPTRWWRAWARLRRPAGRSTRLRAQGRRRGGGAWRLPVASRA